jgi:hypothetical protein
MKAVQDEARGCRLHQYIQQQIDAIRSEKRDGGEMDWKTFLLCLSFSMTVLWVIDSMAAPKTKEKLHQAAITCSSGWCIFCYR